MEPDSEQLRRAVDGVEARIEAVARACAPHIRFAMTPRDKAAVRRGLAEIAVLRQELALRINQYRAWRPGVDERPNPPVPLAGPGRKPSPLPRSLYLNALDLRAQRLAVLTGRLGAMLSRRRQPLFAPLRPKPSLQDEQLAVSDRVFKTLHQVVNPADQDADAAAYGCHLDIPLAPSVFLANAHAALRLGIAQGRAAMRFIDVGCGGGVKVMLAAEVFAQADGLEYDPGYVAAAQAAFRLMSVPRARVFQADAMNFDGYGDYDVIFFYQPMQSAEDLKQLERRIITMAPPGTILIAPYVQFAARAASLGCGHVGGAVYLSATNQPRTDALRARAETTGTSLIRPGTPIDPRDGGLTPLIEAARRIGFDLD